MYSVAVGDLVRFKAKDYGPGVKDQWKDVTGVILEIIEADGSRTGLSVLVSHPDEASPIPVFAFIDDVELIGEEN